MKQCNSKIAIPAKLNKELNVESNRDVKASLVKDIKDRELEIAESKRIRNSRVESKTIAN